MVFCIVSLNTEAVIELLMYGKHAFARNLESVLPFYCRVCFSLLLSLEVVTSASKQALHHLKICINT